MEPKPSVATVVARLEGRVDTFHNEVFPNFCRAVDGRLDRIEGKLDQRNGDLVQIQEKLMQWDISRARIEGAVGLAKFSWKMVGMVVGALAATGGSAGLVFWILGAISGHI